MKTLHRARWILPLLALAAGLAGAGRLEAAPQPTRAAKVVAVGDGWRLIDVNPGGTGNNMMWEVSPGGVANLPVSQEQKDMLNDAFADEPGSGTGNDTIFASQELYEAMERPDFPAGYEPYIEQQVLADPSKFSIGCEWKTETRNRSWPYSQTLFSESLPFSGAITGGLSLNIPLTGNVTVAATYKIRKCFGVPVGFRFVSATASGNAAVTGDGDLTANASASAQFQREWKLAEPELGEVSFTVGPIPVRLVFTLPIYAGVDLSAAIAGNLEAHLDASASGTFNYTCTPDGCSGSSSFTDQFEFTGPEGSVTVDLDAKAHARVMLRVGVYSSNIAYVEGGLKAYAKAGIWGYFGNTCGDADGIGGNETVRALVADLAWGYQFAWGTGGWLLPDRLNYTGGGEFPLAWQDLLGPGGSTVLQPMILGPASVVQGAPASYTIKMRPCYPYTEAVTFTMAPGTWTGPTSVTPPNGTAAVQRTFPNAGNQTLVATAVSDTFGRNLQASYSRNISVTSNTPNAPSALSATVLSPTSVRLNWADNSNNETQFEIQRRLSPSGTFAQVVTAGANATTATDNTAQAGTTYDYRVRAWNGGSSSGFSNVVTVTTSQVAPGAPSGLTATGLTPTSVRLNWVDNSTNEAQFEVQRRLWPSGTYGFLANAAANTPTYTDNSVQAGTSYEYKVRATNGAGASAFSNVVVITTAGNAAGYVGCYTDTATRALPVQLGGTTHTIETCKQAAYNAGYKYAGLQYYGYCFGGNTLGYTLVANSECNTPCTSNSAQICGGAWRNSIYDTGYVALPAAPSGVSASYNSAARTITVSWADNSNNEQGFTVQFSYSGSAFSDMANVGANVTSYTTGPNPPTGSYQFRVRAYNAGGASAWSNVASLIAGAPPTTSIAWIQPAESAWGPAGTLTAAGYAANGTGNVQLVWRERSSAGTWGAWTTVAFQAPVQPDTTWSNTISSGNPTNKCHWFDAYTNYSGVTSAVFHYTGAPGCP